MLDKIMASYLLPNSLCGLIVLCVVIANKTQDRG